MTSPYGYLLVHFIEDPGGYAEKIYLAISRGDDPLRWDALNEGGPILTSHLGTTGVRDPFLTFNPKTSTYYIIATDLRVFGGDGAGWTKWREQGSTRVSVWESTDLIRWGRARQLDVAVNSTGGAIRELGMMWAPEATWIDDYHGDGQGTFVVYWSSATRDDRTGRSIDRIYWGTTTDFTPNTYAFGGVLIDKWANTDPRYNLDGSGTGFRVIDTTIVQHRGRTYHVTKNEDEATLFMEVTDSPTWWLPNTEWRFVQAGIGKADGLHLDEQGCEGPAVYRAHHSDRWYLLADTQHGYRPLSTEDIAAGWRILDEPHFDLRPLTKHGGVISLTRPLYEALRAADAEHAIGENLDELRQETWPQPTEGPSR